MGWQKPETVLAYFAGGLFAIGWWLWIDATVYSNCNCPNGHTPDSVRVEWYHYVPGVISTVALIMINLPSWGDINGSMFNEGSSTKARVWLLISFIIAFAAIIASLWLAITHWFMAKPDSQWGGIALILNNVLIFVGSLLYRYSKPSGDDLGF